MGKWDNLGIISFILFLAVNSIISKADKRDIVCNEKI